MSLKYLHKPIKPHGMSKLFKAVRILVGFLLAVILFLIIGVYAIFWMRLRTISSINIISVGEYYEIDYRLD